MCNACNVECFCTKSRHGCVWMVLNVIWGSIFYLQTHIREKSTNFTKFIKHRCQKELVKIEMWIDYRLTEEKNIPSLQTATAVEVVTTELDWIWFLKFKWLYTFLLWCTFVLHAGWLQWPSEQLALCQHKGEVTMKQQNEKNGSKRANHVQQPTCSKIISLHPPSSYFLFFNYTDFDISHRGSWKKYWRSQL